MSIGVRVLALIGLVGSVLTGINALAGTTSNLSGRSGSADGVVRIPTVGATTGSCVFPAILPCTLG